MFSLASRSDDTDTNLISSFGEICRFLFWNLGLFWTDVKYIFIDQKMKILKQKLCLHLSPRQDFWNIIYCKESKCEKYFGEEWKHLSLWRVYFRPCNDIRRVQDRFKKKSTLQNRKNCLSNHFKSSQKRKEIVAKSFVNIPFTCLDFLLDNYLCTFAFLTFCTEEARTFEPDFKKVEFIQK